MMNAEPATSIAEDARRAFVLNDRPLIVDLIELTLNHGLFVVRAAENFAEAEAILATGGRTSPSSTWTTRTPRAPPPPRRLQHAAPQRDAGPRPDAPGRPATKLRAFDLGVDDILTIPFSPEELLARSIVITRGDPGPIGRSCRRSRSARWRSTSSIARSAPGTSVVHLTSIEQSLLYLLASRAGRS